MKFFEGAPDLAVEVRSENDYDPKAEHTIAQKIAVYFVAGTQMVWDVDLLGQKTVKVCRAADPYHPTVYRRGETAVAGWTMPIDDLFE